MKIFKTTINSSPFVGVFSCASEKFALVPHSTSQKKVEEIEENMEVKVIKTSLANCPLLGVLCVMFEDKIVVSEIVEESEKKFLEKNGLKVKQLKGYTAIGNLVSVNKNGGIASTLMSPAHAKEIANFFGIKIVQKDIAQSNLVGAAAIATDKGFIVHPNVTKPEFLAMQKIFGVEGNPTTANYGDSFIGNDIVANSKGAMVGEITTTFELTRIDEALRGS